nr:hypothetical protein [uncultured Marvinbryantia sp.]
MRQQIPKAAMRATNNAMRGFIPHSSIVSSGAKIVAGQQAKKGRKGSEKKKKRVRLTEISQGSGKPVLRQNVNVNQAAKKLWDYEKTGLSPNEIIILIERERNLTEQVKRYQEY